MAQLTPLQEATLNTEYEKAVQRLDHLPVLLGNDITQIAAWSRGYVAGELGRAAATYKDLQSPELREAASNWATAKLNTDRVLGAEAMSHSGYYADATLRGQVAAADRNNIERGFKIETESVAQGRSGKEALAETLFKNEGIAVPAQVHGIQKAHEAIHFFLPASDFREEVYRGIIGDKPLPRNMGDFRHELLAGQQQGVKP